MDAHDLHKDGNTHFASQDQTQHRQNDANPLKRFNFPGAHSGARDPTKKKTASKRVFGLDPGVEEIDSVVFHDLHWWTADRDIIQLLEHLNITITDKDIMFMEHKVNGKSKGQCVVDCHSKDQALVVYGWMQSNVFQGKAVLTTLAASILGNPFHPNNQDLPAPRPLSSAIHHTMNQATNSHGGVNFNRVNKTLRMNQAGLGNGHPSGIKHGHHSHIQPQHTPQQAHQHPHQFGMAGYPSPGQALMMGMFPMDPNVMPWSPQAEYLSDYSEFGHAR
ncbi:hypothetical protein L198_03745 [Cryptococcus wingfieldii CBS 7118]|uniref:RRM domain-containing protein n=1 Tax=Cryptococcus wingfieldii CBS 7118 TaxID=1295528 RepID=A0A1E3JC99_9TREE|nr:hypothetical protein L198_03745 [Cryptococcus wingfieldii CBS 7118]ODN98500.1 hypothetical protein L198_03745 [Cryptococcus wingfieldii CBS 7118]